MVESGGVFPVPFVRVTAVQFMTWPAAGALGPVVTLPATPASNVRPAMSDSGVVGVAWQHANGPESDAFGPILTSTLAPGGAPEPAVAAPTANPARSLGPEVAFGARGELVTVWQEKVRPAPFSVAAPLTGRPARPAPRSARGERCPRPMSRARSSRRTGDGRALVVWTDPRVRAALYRSGAGFLRAAAPAAIPAPLTTLAMAAAGDHAVLAWQTVGRRLLVSARRA